jgi:NAD(P)-dependent dehydrogenase (short-subunit alcohol dehydrogenase family)
MQDWSGHGAIVTGAASGLGAATAARLAESGLRVTIFDMDADAGQTQADKIGGGFAIVDVSDPQSVSRGIAMAESSNGPTRILVNCAGIGGASKTVSRGEAHDPALFDRVIRVNLMGSFNCASQVAARMVAADGQIGQLAYSASKGGIVGMTLPMARDLADKGIRVCTIAPGLFLTPLLHELPPEVQASLGAQVPFPSRLGDPGEFGEMVDHITRNPMLNGEVIRLDGAIRMGPR